MQTMRAHAALLLSALPAALSMGPGQSLVLNWCTASSPQQSFAVNAAAGTVVDAATQKLCVTQSSPYPAALTMELCDGSASQQWHFNASTQWPLAFTQDDGAGACTLWNTQGGPGYERAGSTVGVYACSAPTPFDSVFAVGFPFPGALAAMYTEPGNSTFSDLCVEALVPPPPPLGTPAQIAYQLSEMACCECPPLLPAFRLAASLLTHTLPTAHSLPLEHGHHGRDAGVRWRGRAARHFPVEPHLPGH